MKNCSLRHFALCLSVLMLNSGLSVAHHALAQQPDNKPPQSQPPKLTPEQQGIDQLNIKAIEAATKGTHEGYETAIKLWKEALEKSQSLNDAARTASSLYNLGNVNFYLGLYEKALDYYTRALQIQEKLGNQDDIARSLNNLGNASDILGQYDKALYYGNRALQVREKQGRQDVVADSLDDLGNVYANLGQYEKALECHNRARKIYEKLDKQTDMAMCLNNLGVVYKSLSQYDKALDYFNQALHIKEKLSKPDDIARSLDNIGLVYDSLGQEDKALDYLNQALQLRQELKNPYAIASSLNNLGGVYASLGQYDKALDYYDKAYVLFKKLNNSDLIASSLNNIGGMYAKLGQYDKALDYLNQALHIKEKLSKPDDIANTLYNIGLVYAEFDHYDKVLEYTYRALQIQEKGDKQDAIAYSLNNLGVVYAEQKQWGKAEAMYARARTAFETLSKQVGDPTQLADLQQILPSLYAGYADVLAQQKRPEEALTLLEGGRARGIARQLFLNRSNYSSMLMKEEAATLKQSLSDLCAANNLLRAAQQHLAACSPDLRSFFQKSKNEYEKKVRDAERKYDAFYADLFKRYPKFRIESGEVSVTRKEWLTLADKNPDTLFLTWAMLGDKHADLYVIGKQEKLTLKTFTLDIGEKDLQKMASEWRRTMGVGNRGVELANAADEQGEAKQATALYKALFGPIEKMGMLAKGRYKRIVIVPSGPLLELPFAALMDGQGKRLVENYAVSSATLLDTSLWMTNPNTPTTDLLCIADPIGEAVPKTENIASQRADFGPLFGPLKEARDEGIAVGGLFHTIPLIGPDAKKADVLKAIASAKFLHFATHGFLNARNPFYSGLVLAPDPKDSRRYDVLYAQEILNMGLSAKMAVLSACDTGRGVAKGNDGLQGLVWAFQAAGCPCVVASQWSVDDAATKNIMVAFYKNLTEKHQRKDDAMRDAMLKVMQTQPSPKFWAAFQVIGDTSAF